jgi:hypothetical protein
MMPPDDGGGVPHHQDASHTTNTSTHQDADTTRISPPVDIAPDIDCPHCGPVIVCPHTMHHVKPNPARSDIECTDSFLENMRRLKAYYRAGDDWSDYFDNVHAVAS